MMERKEKKERKKLRELYTNSSLNPDISFTNPFRIKESTGGSSVDDLREVEAANEFLAGEEVDQQNENG